MSLTMRSLFEVNVLLALFQPDHVHFDRAQEWWKAHQQHGWASCPLTQNGFARILSPADLSGSPCRPPRPITRLRRANRSRPTMCFGPTTFRSRTRTVFDPHRLLGPEPDHRRLSARARSEERRPSGHPRSRYFAARRARRPSRGIWR